MINQTIKELKEYADNNFVPIITDNSLKVLLETIKDKKPKNVLEIGTAIGYSGLQFLSNSDCNLLTVELDTKRYEIAKNVFNKCGYNKRVNLLNIDAFELLNMLNTLQDNEKLNSTGDSGDINFTNFNNQKFDFIFLDGPKGQYSKYLPLIKPLLSDGGVLFCDNIYFKGWVLTDELPPKKHRTIVKNLKKFIDDINNDTDLLVKFINVDDGLAIIKKIK